MPKVKPNESKEDFISRCIPIVESEGEEHKRAVAICYSIWEQHDKDK